MTQGCKGAKSPRKQMKEKKKDLCIGFNINVIYVKGNIDQY